ncbi:MAG: hypothetical protein WAT93_02605 [Pontixanthobacter sp.]
MKISLLTVLVCILALAGIVPKTEIHAEDEVQEISACPDGGYESGCLQKDVDAAITLADDYVVTLSRRCLYLTEARCWVVASGTFASMERGGPVIWQHMELAPKDGPAVEMIVMAENATGNGYRLVLAEQTEGYFTPPDLVENSDQGVVFHIPGRMGGTGFGNADVLLVRTKQQWHRVNLDEWFDQVNALLPDGFEIRQGVRFDFREMFAYSPVWRPEDGQCCGSGGTVFIDFRVKEWKLAVDRLAFNPSTPTGKTVYIDGPGSEKVSE